MPESTIVAGVDVGSECVKVILLGGDREMLAHAVVPATGYFQQRVREALDQVLDEAQVAASAIRAYGVTGFGARCAGLPDAMQSSDATSHARGAFHHFQEPMTVVDLGGRAPTVSRVDGQGQRTGSRCLRRCAMGIGTFLMFTARHLDVHPTRLMELAAAADEPVSVSSFCSVFASSEILERIRDGATREQVALGCISSVAERILELGPLEAPLVVTGGVPEYFPGVPALLGQKAGIPVHTVPEPIIAGALGIALIVLDRL